MGALCFSPYGHPLVNSQLSARCCCQNTLWEHLETEEHTAQRIYNPHPQCQSDKHYRYCPLTIPCRHCKCSHTAGNNPCHTWLGKGRHAWVDHMLIQVKLLNRCRLNCSCALPFAASPSSRGHHVDNESLWKGTHAACQTGTNLAQTHLPRQLIFRHQAPCRIRQDAERVLGQLCHGELTSSDNTPKPAFSS